MKRKYFAHSKEGRPPEEWQLLDDHLASVAKKASEFAAKFETYNFYQNIF
jgi:hypothetical protein